jgi:hypothetical protein
MADAPLVVEFHTPEEAAGLWHTGLRHGVLLLPPRARVAIGSHVRVRLGLAYARLRFDLEGEVTELPDGARGVLLDFLPQGLHSALRPQEEDDGWMADDDGLVTDEVLGTIESTYEESDEYSEAEDRSETSLSSFKRGSSESVQGPPPEIGPDGATPRRVWSRSGETEAVEGFTIPDGSGRILPAPPRFSGKMGRKGWSPVLLHVLNDHLTGVLLVEGEVARCWVYCRRGYPVHVVRAPARDVDSFQHHAISTGTLEPEIATQCRHLSQVTGRSFMSVVMRLQLLPDREVRRLRELVVTHALRDALEDVRGEYRFFDEPELDDLFMDAPAPVIRTLVKWSIEEQAGITQESADELIVRHGRDHVFLTPLGLEALAHMGLNEFQSRILHSLVVEDQALAQVAIDVPEHHQPIMQLLFALLTLGMLDSGEPPIGAQRDRLAAERRLRSFAGRLDLDLFSLVGGHWTDVHRTLEAAVADAMDILLAAPTHPDEDDDLTDLRRRITRAVVAAEETLLVPQRRREYRSKLVRDRELEQGAAMLYRQGLMAHRMGQHERARERLEMALELEPGGGRESRRSAKIVAALDALPESRED